MSNYNIPEVTKLCTLTDDALDIDRQSQVEHLSSIMEMDYEQAKAFYARNHVTDGMKTFLRGSLKRMHSGSGQGIYELRQAMGGGKTHNMIMLGLLSRFPELANLLPEEITEGIRPAEAHVAIVNGRSIKHYMMGDIALQLEGDSFSSHWTGTPDPMSEQDWMDLIGDKPTLIMLDELPPYLALARTRAIGEGTLLDVLTYTISNLLSAVMKLPHAVVVIGSLDAAYNSAGEALDEIYASAIADLKKETERGAKSITPVDLNTGEIYDILRKRLFATLPDRDGEEVGRVIDAYAGAFEEAIKGKAIAKSAEVLADEIHDSYPFHPGYKDILALFKENPKFRQTRGLIEFTSNLLRSVWNDQDREHFLIGAQCLDFADVKMRDQVKDIEKSLESALSTDIFDMDGGAHAQSIADSTGDPAAMEVATLIFISSLSDNVDGIRGLRVDDIMEYLVAPGRDPTTFKQAFELLQKKCWYLHTKDDRFYFSDMANVRKQVEDKMSRIQQDQIDEEMRRRLTDCFEPRRKTAYQDLIVLPRREDISITASRRTCIVLSPDAKAPPETARKIFEEETYKNNFCVVSSDGTQMAKAEDSIRRIIAIAFVSNQVIDNRHKAELEVEAGEAVKNFITEVKALFNTVWFPSKDGLRSINLEFDNAPGNSTINGEDAVEKALQDRKMRPVEESTFKGLISQAQDYLFKDEKRVKWDTILQRAAHDSRWPWLPPRGLEQVKAEAIRQERWTEENGLVDIDPAPPKPMIKVMDTRWKENDGVYEIELLVSNTGKNIEIQVADSREGFESAVKAESKIHSTDKVEQWFRVRDLEKDEVSDPVRWLGEIRLAYQPREHGDKWLVELEARPAARIRWNITGAGPDSLENKEYDGTPIEIDGTRAQTLYVFATKGSVNERKEFRLEAIGGKGDTAAPTIPEGPVRLNKEISLGSKGQVVRALQNLKAEKEVKVSAVTIKVGEGETNLQIRTGRELPLTVLDVEALINALVSASGNPDSEVIVQIKQSVYPDYHLLAKFMKDMAIDFTIREVEKEG
jgi:hypothetical protein